MRARGCTWTRALHGESGHALTQGSKVLCIARVERQTIGHCSSGNHEVEPARTRVLTRRNGERNEVSVMTSCRRKERQRIEVRFNHL